MVILDQNVQFGLVLSTCTSWYPPSLGCVVIRDQHVQFGLVLQTSYFSVPVVARRYGDPRSECAVKIGLADLVPLGIRRRSAVW